MSVLRLFPILALTAAFAAPLVAGAQSAPAAAPPAPVQSAPPLTGGHHHRHHQSFMHALRAVNLTPAQQQQVAAFHDAEIKANLNADPATKKANAEKLRGQIMGILTPDQKTQLSAQMHRAHAPVPGMAPDPAASPAGN